MPPTIDFHKQIAGPGLFHSSQGALTQITFSIRKGENLARKISSKDSMTMNLEKFATSFSEFNSERFLFVFN